MIGGDSDKNTGRRIASALRQVAKRRLPDKWASRLGLVRGLFVKDGATQMRRLMMVARHFRDYQRIDRALFYHRFTATLLLAHRLGIFDVLRGEPSTASAVAHKCDIGEKTAHNLLRILESQELVECTEDRYEATEFAEEFFDPQSSVSMVPMLEVCDAYAEAFPFFVDAARSGQTPALLDIFDDQGRTDALLNGVNYYLDQAGRELIARVDWPPIRHFIVGSMGVSFSSLVISAFDEARVTYGCLPHLVERIPRLRKQYGVPDGRVDETHSHGGEPADDRWGREAFDLVFLTKKMILDPSNNLGPKFAQKAFDVLNPVGVTVFWETIHDDLSPTPVDRAMEGFLDFGVSPDGPVLTGCEFCEELEHIGYRDVEVVECLQGATTFTVARK